MSQNTQTASGGVGFLGLLAVFIAFKLLGIISWSWLWVLSPLWIPLAIAGLILTAMITIPFAAMLVLKLRR